MWRPVATDAGCGIGLPIGYSHCCANAVTYGNACAYGNAHAYTNAHACTNAYAYTNADAHAHAHAHAYGYGYGDTHTYGNAHGFGDAHTDPISTPESAGITEIYFAGVASMTNVPSQVEVVFSLRDQEGHAIVLPAEEIQRATRVYERGPGTDGWEEIDYAETGFFVHTAQNFDLEVVFALDFTNSMAEASLPDGRTGIDAMLEAVSSGLDLIPNAHRIGVVEFHDRNADPGVLSVLTTDRQAIHNSIADFSDTSFDPGSSRVWDGVFTAARLFSTREQNPRTVRALVFLSDGRDTSSVKSRDDVRRDAEARGVRLYALGIGEVFQEYQLREMVESTGGGYYAAQDVSLLQEQLQALMGDLRGLYKASFTTLRGSGYYRARVSVELPNALGHTETDPYDVARFFGPDNQGVIRVDPPSVDRSAQSATAFVRALHVPRNIARLRFRFDTSKPLFVELVGQEDGGLLHSWTLSRPDREGFYSISSPEPVAFGNFGLLFKLIVADLTERSLEIPIEFDNSIYTGGKRLSDPLRISIAQPIDKLTLPQMLGDLSSWTEEYYGPRIDHEDPEWDVLDSVTAVQRTNNPPSFLYADRPLRGSRITVNLSVAPNNDDDDLVGFAVGFMPGDTTNGSADYLLIDWKRRTQDYDFGFPSTSFGGTSHRGLAVSRVRGIPDFDELWQHRNLQGTQAGSRLEELQRGARLGAVGWRHSQTYEFTVELSPTTLWVYVDGNLELNLETPRDYTEGRLAFYVFSQADVEFSIEDVQ